MESSDALASELMSLERKYWTALMNRDARTAASLSDDPCVVVGAQGIGEIDRGTLGKMLRTVRYELKAFSFADFHVHRLSDDVAAVAYKVREDLEVDGEDLTLEAFDTSIWTLRDGAWTCAIHTESLAGDPFGRH